MTTSGQLELITPSELTGSSAASLAKEQALPVGATALTTPRPFCGGRCSEPLASYDPESSSWRTWRTSLLSEMEPSGEKFSGTWPRSVSMSSGIAYQQQPSAPLTAVTASSPLLPTPRANIAKQGLPRPDHWGEMRAEVMALLPTPSATDYGNNQSPSDGAAVRESLPRLIKLLPTPRANDGLRLRQAWSTEGRRPTLEQAIVESQSNGVHSRQLLRAGHPLSDLRLSPYFVEWMIGAPPGWSDPDCPLSATEFKSNSVSWWGAT